jgi:hypothetical protein
MKKITSKNITNVVNNFPVKYEYGFTASEINTLLTEYDLNEDLFYQKLGVNTCMVIEGQTITYHCDIEKALFCLVENRDEDLWEWD